MKDQLQQKPTVMVAHASNHPINDYVIPTNEELHLSIVRPAIYANNFELNSHLMSMAQYN